MTRTEFLEGNLDLSQLLSFSRDIECYEPADDFYDECGKNEYVDEMLSEWIYNCTWQEVLGILEDIPTGYGWYVCVDGEFKPVDEDDVEYLRECIADYCDENEIWEEEEQDDEEKQEEEPEFDIENDEIFMNLIAK